MTGVERQTVPWKVVWPVTGFVLTGSGVSLAAILDVSLLITAPSAVVVAAGVVVGAHLVVHRSPIFSNALDRSRTAIVRWIAAAVVAHAVWAVLFGLRPGSWLVWWLLLAGIAVLEYGVAVALEYLLTRPRPVTPARAGSPSGDQRELTDPEKQFTAGLRKADLGAATVVGSTPIVDDETGHTFGMRFDVQAPLGK